ncbi:MAG TPA: MOSC N-terminal beta barrel domain-containing protein [Nocardioides sp.]|uniref:MOSC domain-containing protein n=1 Tax=Nocardioides sp. TaxID=35761 RepID=UPI002E2F596A|nr:MOSC N-terminal beta barrel domain-containing protein [Nocardioides sp.]HEX3932191.1 MOSC N-terminal beta barrel domain-containing protein [Nocardioides sp.]
MSPLVLQEIRRYPVKAMGGESLESVELDVRGLAGDRAYAVVDGDGRLASGKHSRRFRRRDQVFEFASRSAAGGVRVSGRGHDWPVPSAELDGFLSEAMGDDVRVLPETSTPYFDAGAVSLVGTASLAWCREHLDVDADRRRIRPNLVVETDEAFVEESWTGQVAVGAARLRPVQRIERCRMIDIAQEGLPGDGRWLKALTLDREMSLGVYLDVVRPGRIAVGDQVDPATGTG